MTTTYKTLKLSACVLAATFGAAQAQAATLGVLTNDYGSAAGNVDPGGNDVLMADAVIVSDASTSRFFDGFDLSAFTGDTITDLVLTLTFSNAGPSLFPTELWTVRVQGSDAGDTLDDMLRPLSDDLSPQSFALNASTLLAGDAFAHTVATGSYEFWFSEFTPSGFFGAPDAFALDQASLTVIGEPAAVPLPASMPLLMAGLGGFAALRRARKSK